jgi:bifunctional DNA-binding transcriptional regulator/antitoxin component of YhaV-PrlF toxin-antitoxin module
MKKKSEIKKGDKVIFTSGNIGYIEKYDSKSVCGWCGEKRLLNQNGSCKCCACLDDEQTVC